MERSMDIKMAAHAIAADRRKKGQKIWARSIHLKQFLNVGDGVTPEQTKKAAKNIHDALKSDPWIKARNAEYGDWDHHMDDAFMMLEDAQITGDTEDLNEALRIIYDEADLDRVFIK